MPGRRVRRRVGAAGERRTPPAPGTSRRAGGRPKGRGDPPAVDTTWLQWLGWAAGHVGCRHRGTRDPQPVGGGGAGVEADVGRREGQGAPPRRHPAPGEGFTPAGGDCSPPRRRASPRGRRGRPTRAAAVPYGARRRDGCSKDRREPARAAAAPDGAGRRGGRRRGPGRDASARRGGRRRIGQGRIVGRMAQRREPERAAAAPDGAGRRGGRRRGPWRDASARQGGRRCVGRRGARHGPVCAASALLCAGRRNGRRRARRGRGCAIQGAGRGAREWCTPLFTLGPMMW